MSVVLVFAGVALAMFAPEVVRVMSDRSYWGAATIVPVLVLQNVITVATRFSRFGLLVEGRTKAFLMPSIVSTLGATAVGVALVGPLGATGIAWALVFQAAMNLWLIERQQRTTFDVDLPWGRFWAVVAMGVAAYLLSLAVPPGTWQPLGLKLIIFAVFVCAVFYSPIVGDQERSAVWRLTQDLINKARRPVRA